MTALRLGTRRSALALAQSGGVAATLIAQTARDVELVEVTTRGDVDPAALTQIGGTGVFVSALRDALLAGDVDLAVHSLKDLPTQPADGLVLAAVPAREDPRDVLFSPAGLTLGELPAGARVGTGSPRRAAQLRALGLGLEVVPIRGNVDTRLKKCIDGEYDAVVLARAGLARLDRLDAVTEVLDPIQVLPAPGQGALAVECRAGSEVAELVAVLDDPDTRACVLAERALLRSLEAGCTAPVGALADLAEDEIYLRAAACAADGSDVLRRSLTGPVDEPEALGARLAAVLLEDGAAELMGESR
ncbi:MAG TPA: hydroxymethylbilane synthase [Mycobacteriales bacterium]|jgi:hydroxymethylbilane synthase|nr:hydroxymethylbilane synthase [Mycobacteriales bacterium]